MSQHQPTEPYVYQPGALSEGSERIWGVGGPGTKGHEGKRYTKAEAERIVARLKVRRLIEDSTGKQLVGVHTTPREGHDRPPGCQRP